MADTTAKPQGGMSRKRLAWTIFKVAFLALFIYNLAKQTALAY